MPRTILTTDSSGLTLFMNCRRKWYYRNVLGIVPRGTSNMILDRGTLAHAMLDLYYKNVRQVGPLDAQRYVKKTLQVNKLGLKALTEEDIEFVWDRFKSYVQYWTMEGELLPLTDDSVEIGFSKVLLDSPSHLFIVEGRIDLISNNEVVVDHKTQESANDLFEYNPQPKTYLWATGFRKFMYNYFGCQKVLNPKSFRRQPITMPKEMINEWEARMKTMMFEMCAVRDSFSLADMNETYCKAYYRLCEYNELDVQYNESIKKQLIDFKFEKAKKWEPWSLKEIG